MLSINQVLQEGRYRIVSHFGQEETGPSYQAFDNVLKTKVIIKETIFDASAQSSFFKQIEGLTSIKHELFMQVHGCFSEVNRQYLVTESVEGENLKSVLERKKRPFLLFDVLSWTEQLLDALIYLHTKTPPIIHHHVAPYNLMLTKDNRIKLLASDFNLAGKKSEKKSFASERLPFTSLELLWDTLDPASQKVILNSYDENSAEILESPLDPRSDIYGLGATIYYLVTGVVPVDALERSIDLLEGKKDPLANPSQINPQIPRKFSYFLMKSLELKRENRFGSATQMRSELQPMLELMKKVERETQKALEDPKVREAALREVELARESLRKQREAENLHKSQDPPLAETKISTEPQAVESAKIPQTPISQSTFLEGIEKAKQNLPQRKDTEPTSPKESVKVVAAPVTPIAVQTMSKPNQNLIDDSDGVELFADAQVKSGKSWLIPILCIVVLLLVGGFFGFRFLNSNQTTDTSQEAVKQSVPPAAETPKTEMPITVASETPNVPAQTASPTASPSPTVETPAVMPDEDKAKTKKAMTPTPPIEKKPTPAAKSPTPKKKELTVDDLIN